MIPLWALGDGAYATLHTSGAHLLLVMHLIKTGCDFDREGGARSFQNWTHWDLNPGPSACEADVIPLHHVPSEFLVEFMGLIQNGPAGQTGLGGCWIAPRTRFRPAKICKMPWPPRAVVTVGAVGQLCHAWFGSGALRCRFGFGAVSARLCFGSVSFRFAKQLWGPSKLLGHHLKRHSKPRGNLFPGAIANHIIGSTKASVLEPAPASQPQLREVVSLLVHVLWQLDGVQFVGGLTRKRHLWDSNPRGETPSA